jgi:Transposase DDE domain
LRSAEPWLAALTSRLFARTRFGARVGRGPGTQRVLRVVDATTVLEPGGTETDWRVHYSVRLKDLGCDHFQITRETAGETFKRFPVRRGDILMGDRGYGHREGVAHVVQKEGDVIVRLNLVGFPLLAAQGSEAFDVLQHLRGMKDLTPQSWPVQFEWKKKKYPARLCAIRKTQRAAQKAQELLRKREKKKKNGKKQRLLEETLESAEYIYVLTTVPGDELNANEILELYRLRWQIELVFKRLKSLLRLSELPKHTDSSSRAWLQGKLLVALLIERLTETAELFSPWGHDLHSPEPLA